MALSPAALFTFAACFLAFNYASEYLFALEIYVVPFSNAKVVGSFRMARLNMFRRGTENFSSPSGSKFCGSLAVHGTGNYTASTLKAL